MDTDSDQRAKMLENGSSAPIVTLEMDEVEKKPTAWQRFKVSILRTEDYSVSWQYRRKIFSH